MLMVDKKGRLRFLLPGKGLLSPDSGDIRQGENMLGQIIGILFLLEALP